MVTCDVCGDTGECVDQATDVLYVCPNCFKAPYEDDGQPDDLQENQDFAQDDCWHNDSDFDPFDD